MTNPTRIAAFLADLTAQGLPGRAEALAALLGEAVPSQGGTAAAIPKPESDRAAAARAARTALAPLIESRAPRQALRAAAACVSRHALRPPEIEALTTDAIARHLRAARTGRPA